MHVGTGRYMTPEELRAWTRFLDAGRLMEELLARHLKDDHGMLHGEYEVLVRVDGAGGRMRLRELADQVVASHSRLSHMLDRLERRGWIRREPIPSDGRGLDAVITPAGRQALAESAGEHAALIRQFLLDQMSDDELALVADVMDRVATKLRERRSGTGGASSEDAASA